MFTLSQHTDSLLTGHEPPGKTRHVTGPELRIGVVLEAFLDWPLERILPWLRQAAPEITDIEVGAGGDAPHPPLHAAAPRPRGAGPPALAGPLAKKQHPALRPDR